ncbi:UDP-N-acetylglucosamine transferase subunit ALG13 [Blattella germanica]|nr:UDP-N-acetylglucosamine transferase subunit ALG13 [Blattella germanica]
MASKHVFATVGTTKFDLFISALSSQNILNALASRGYGSLTMQIGHGSTIPPSGKREGIEVDHFRFKDSLTSDVRSADLVISHAGAGSCLEALEAGKPLLVVINEELMNNHQMELAEQLYKDEHVYYTTCKDLEHVLRTMDLGLLKPFAPADTHTFAHFLDKMFGFECK